MIVDIATAFVHRNSHNRYVKYCQMMLKNVDLLEPFTLLLSLVQPKFTYLCKIHMDLAICCAVPNSGPSIYFHHIINDPNNYFKSEGGFMLKIS